MATVDASVIMQFVYDEIAEVFEELGPFGVMRQNPGVEHVGIGEDDVGFVANRPAGIGRRVAS